MSFLVRFIITYLTFHILSFHHRPQRHWWSRWELHPRPDHLLTNRSSASWLFISFKLERMDGTAPPSSDWKPDIILLYDIRIFLIYTKYIINFCHTILSHTFHSLSRENRSAIGTKFSNLSFDFSK